MCTPRRIAAGRILVLAATALVLLAGPALAQAYYWGDGTPDGKRSIGGGGHLVFYDVGADGRWLNAIEMFGSRYGGAEPPDEDFHLYIVDIERTILAEVALPYSLWERGEEYWRDLPIPPMQVPRQFGIGLTFNAEQTKGVFVGIDNGRSYSYSWVPGGEGTPTEDFNWMIRATVEDEPFGDPDARELIVLTDGVAFFDTVTGMTADGAVQTAGQGALAMGDITTIRLDAFRPQVAGGVTVVLTSGATVRGALVGIDAESVRLDAGGQERTIPKELIARIDF